MPTVPAPLRSPIQAFFPLSIRVLTYDVPTSPPSFSLLPCVRDDRQVPGPSLLSSLTFSIGARVASLPPPEKLSPTDRVFLVPFFIFFPYLLKGRPYFFCHRYKVPYRTHGPHPPLRTFFPQALPPPSPSYLPSGSLEVIVTVTPRRPSPNRMLGRLSPPPATESIPCPFLVG